ncbi:F0F1 ATP synthase subunit B [Maridesulfovibrio zosterae]|uniref:F0F1 ATP synthase subunit B n=1 Tax=Maridesulfovibrio zosterae TaxID=82171 RepID=UPI00047F7AB4|nr:F0F1 ATP synthase subunit B [Maridesulfovibrio zosterae]
MIMATATLSVLLAAGAAYASGGEGGAHEIPWANFGWRVLNLILVLGVLYKFAGEKIAGLFKGRQAGIKQELNDLQSRKEAAESKLRDVEQSIANLEQEKEAILSEARSQGEAMKAAIIQKAEQSAEQIKAQAKVSAEQEVIIALDEMRAEMADKVIEAAEKIVKSKLTKAQHENLVDEYLTKVVLN